VVHEALEENHPAVIESANREAGWKLRGETVEWWNQYRSLVQDLNPDLVQDQVLQAASQFAQTEFQKLSKRKEHHEERRDPTRFLKAAAVLAAVATLFATGCGSGPRR